MRQTEYITKTMYPKVTIESQSLGTFTCNDCGKRYNRKGNLGRHKRYECGKDKQFRCVFCPKSFFRRDKLCFHVKMCHQFDM
jgi:hypothetical protein